MINNSILSYVMGLDISQHFWNVYMNLIDLARVLSMSANRLNTGLVYTNDSKSLKYVFGLSQQVRNGLN